MTAVDDYLADLTARLHVGGRAHERIAAEVRDHLDEAIDARVRGGASADAAATEALAAFGSASGLAAQFNVEAGTRAMRRAPAVAFGAGVLAVAGFLLAATTQPTAASTGTRAAAGAAVQGSFFAAVLAFEVAVVAGICAAARAMTVWRSRGVRSEDRAFVRRCSMVSLTFLAVAAAGWAMAVTLSYDHIVHPNTATMIVGLAGMVAAPLAGGGLALRLRVNASDDDPDAEPVGPGVLGIGELAIDVVRRHPVLACVLVVPVAAASAMSHAETTFTGALPWGIAQALAVVAGFVLLGPVLELRRPERIRPT